MAVDKSLVSGSTTMLLLKLLSEKDMYGYEMIEELKKRSENVFALKAGTLYPLLHGMEDKGLLTCYEQEFQGITGKGRKELQERKNSWQEYSHAVASVLCCGV